MNAKVDSANLSRELARQASFQKAPGVLQDAAAPKVRHILADGRIPIEFLTQDLEFEIEQFVQEYDGDVIQPLIRKAGAANWENLLPGDGFLFLPPIADRVWPLVLTVPVARLKEDLTPEAPTAYELMYNLYADGGNEGKSFIATYAVDLTAPYRIKTPASNLKPRSATFPASLPPGTVIDEAFIQSHQAGVAMVFESGYPNQQDTDVLEVFFGISTDPDYATVKWTGPMPLDGRVTLPISVFSGLKEGVNTLTYRVTDLPGNVSKTSNSNSREVKFLADPVTQPPIVFGADGTGGDVLIDLADCNAGVKVTVLRPVTVLDTDSILPTWGTIDLTEQRVGPGASLEFPVDYQTHIKAEYGNTEGEVSTVVKYVVLRGAKKIGENQTTIDVDLSYPGPENPNEPDPVNPALELARLESSLGNENELQDGDYGKDATVFVKLWAPPPVTEEGQIIDVYYEGEKFGTKLLGADEGEIQLDFILPWDVIARYGNGSAPDNARLLHWVLYTPDGNNPVESRRTPVDVSAVRIILPPPVVQKLNPLRNIICSTLGFPNGNRKVPVVIPKSPYLKDGEVVTLVWEGFSDSAATTPIPGTREELPYTISGTVPEEGISLEIGDYMTHIRPVQGGYGKLTYSVPVAGETPDPSSEPAVHGVRLLNNNGDFCEDA